MPVPLRTRLFWAAYRLVDRDPLMQAPVERIRRRSDQRRRLLRMVGARLITGRPDPSVTIRDDAFTSPDGTRVAFRCYRPNGEADLTLPVVVNFHGGGWVSGDPQQSEWWCAGVAAGTGAMVVSVDYRLAPEHRFPVPLDDCFAATRWVAEHAADLHVDAQRLAVMGDSAGGNLAAAVAVRARDDGGPPLAAQVLIYPAVDIGTHYPSASENAAGPVLTRADVDHVWTLYLADADDRRDPCVSPLHADHRLLPPALIQTAQHDPLRDQGRAYAEALRAAGVPVRLTNYVDAVHGFISLPGVTSGAQQALAETVAFLRDAFDGGVR